MFSVSFCIINVVKCVFLKFQCAPAIDTVYFVCLFVCLFGFGVHCPAREFFTYMDTSPLPVKGCKFRPMLGTFWQLSSEGSLKCHTHCETGLPFIMVISEDT